MPYKWNENTTLIFLNAYQKHPCLWNPYYVRYYDCLAKNEALRNILKELNISQLNMSDCLEHIKVIREKYGQEQIRIIKGFQSQEPYKSTFAWFSIVSEMLTKVIKDEAKLQKGMKSMEANSSILKNCVTIPYDKHENISNFPCAQETKLNYKTKPKKNSKFTKTDTTGNLNILNDKSKDKNDMQLLQCPSCGWEDIKLNKLNATAKKTFEQTKPLDNAALRLEYNLADKPYEEYNAYRHRISNNTYQGRYNNTVPSSSFSNNLSSYPVNVLPITTHTYRLQDTRDINQPTTQEAIVTTEPKFYTKGTQFSNEQLFLEKQTKQVETITEHCDKGIQNTTDVSKTNVTLLPPKCTPMLLTSNHVERDTVQYCSHDATEIIKYNSAVIQALLQYLEKIIPLQEERAKMHSIASLSLKNNVNFDSSEGTVCEPCKIATESLNIITSSPIELESPSCLPCLNEMEKDYATAMFIKAFLELMQHTFMLNSKKCTENVQEGYARKEDIIDTFTVLSKIKECADRILKIYTVVDYSKKQNKLSNKFCPRYKSKDKCPPKANLALSLIQTEVSKNGTNQFTTSYTNSNDIKVLYGPPTLKIRDHSYSENDSIFIETAMEEKPSVKDKEITAHSENRDIGLNVSPQVSLRDSGTQYTPKQLHNVEVVTEHGQSFEEKISVGIQNCDFILVRVIKCNNSGEIRKLDKETYVRDVHIARARNVDKYTETGPELFSHLSKNMNQKYLVRECYNEDLLCPSVSHICKKEVNCISYNQKWIKTNIPTFGLLSNQHVSRIPLYARSHKYTRKRTNLYRMSQSYA